jgi:hypothetical protein
MSLQTGQGPLPILSGLYLGWFRFSFNRSFGMRSEEQIELSSVFGMLLHIVFPAAAGGLPPALTAGAKGTGATHEEAQYYLVSHFLLGSGFKRAIELEDVPTGL